MPAEADGPAIRARGLRKDFGKVRALDGVSLEVPRGRIYGLLGPNGAGKTTLIRLLTGAARSTAGEAAVFGLPVPDRKRAVRARLGYMPQAPALYGDLTVRENVAFFGRAHALDDPPARVAAALAFAGLADLADRRADTLSGGYRQRCSLACAMVHDPELLLLDEPTAGVDPLLKEAFWKGFRDLAARGVTLLVSTHQVDEALACDRLCVLREGRVVVEDTPGGLLARGGAEVEITAGGETFARRLADYPAELPRLLARYGLSADVRAIRVRPDGFEAVLLRLLREDGEDRP
ncbi:MAG: ABC transporter ATP-binding protein [Acidobacteria bacterium]|nr:ABC transporter ATP-binding protein [Acidobacteriota bacterium]